MVNTVRIKVPAQLKNRIFEGDAVSIEFYYRESYDEDGTITLIPAIDCVDKISLLSGSCIDISFKSLPYKLAGCENYYKGRLKGHVVESFMEEGSHVIGVNGKWTALFNR